MSRRGRPHDTDGKRGEEPTAPVDDRTAEAAGRAVGPIEAAIDKAVHTHVEHAHVEHAHAEHTHAEHPATAGAAPFVPPPLPPLSAHVPTPPGLTPRAKPAASSPPPMSFYRPATAPAAPASADPRRPVPPPDPSRPPARPPVVSSFSTDPKPTESTPTHSTPPTTPTPTDPTPPDSNAMRPRITGTTDVPRLSEAPAALVR